MLESPGWFEVFYRARMFHVRYMCFSFFYFAYRCFVPIIFSIFLDLAPIVTEFSRVPHKIKGAVQNSKTAIIIAVCVALAVIGLGSAFAWYFLFKRGNRKNNASTVIEVYGPPPYPGKRRDILSSTSSSMSNCSTNPLLHERHQSVRYLKRQNSILSNVSL